MGVVNVWVGAPTEGGARVVTKVDSGADVRVAVDTDPGFSAPEFHGPVTPSAEGIASVQIGNLSPATRYHYAVEHNGVQDSSFPGQFRTLPTTGQPASYTVGAASCAGATPETPGVGSVLAANRLSNHDVFATILTEALAGEWLWWAHMGDLHYYDLGSGSHGIAGGGSLANYRRSYDDVLAQPLQHQLYRNLPTVYMYDDHDWGPDNSTGDLPDRGNALQAYRERVPAYPPAVPGAAEPNYHARQLGRVLWVVLDCRANSDPVGTPDGPGKTMLGSAQKTWLAGLLSSSTAEALVVVSTRQWDHPSGADTWAGYATERDELVSIFAAPGGDSSKSWLPRMLIVQGDAHSTGIRSGPANPWGGFPIFQFAPLDAGPTGAQPWKDIGTSGASRGQYGRIQVTDDGATITITGTGRRHTPVGPSTLFSHTLTVETDTQPEPPDPPTPPGPAPTPGVIRTRVRWYGCDLVTGQIIAPLHDVIGTVSRRLGEPTSASLTVPIPRAGPASVPLTTTLQATEPGRTMVGLVVNDVPAWLGVVLIRRGGTAATIELGCATPESYLDRRYVGDHTWTLSDEATIVAGLLGDAQTEGIGLTLDLPPTGRPRTRKYADQDDATVLSRLQELMRVDGGPEWTIDPDWSDASRTGFAKIFRLRLRIGTSAAPPTAVFRTTAASVFGARGSSEARYEYKEDYSDGRGANHVVATSSGEGEDRPQSAPARAVDLLDGGWPRWERRWSPSSSITDLGVLGEHAAAELAAVMAGARTWSFTARWDAYPRLNVDWRLGDDVGWRLVGHRHPATVVGQGRAIGWDADFAAGTVTPLLLDPAAEL